MSMAVDTMVPGGKWIKPPGAPPITYVVHPEHIKRLFSEGGEPVADPRPMLARMAKAEEQSQSDLNAALQEKDAEIARLMALLERDIAAMPDDGIAHTQAEPPVPINRGKR
jgi:hypothetical protein